MKCTAPDGENSEKLDTGLRQGPENEELKFELSLWTEKYEDPPSSSGYNNITVVHKFQFSCIVDNITVKTLRGHNNYDVACNIDTGIISSEYRPISSDPVGDIEIVDDYVFYEDDFLRTWRMTLKIAIFREPFGADVTTRVYATAIWDRIGGADLGSIRLPVASGSTLSITNTFVAQEHER
jgi:hypothetical protein